MSWWRELQRPWAVSPGPLSMFGWLWRVALTACLWMALGSALSFLFHLIVEAWS